MLGSAKGTSRPCGADRRANALRWALLVLSPALGGCSSSIADLPIVGQRPIAALPKERAISGS